VLEWALGDRARPALELGLGDDACSDADHEHEGTDPGGPTTG
jgi:hypothetical protein